MHRNKVILMILDGWGQTQNAKVSAIAQANTPFIDSCYHNFPHAELNTTGLAVGLPKGQMGNSEVGHLNIGAGRVVYQNLAKINMAIEDNTLKDQPELKKAMQFAKENDKKVHLLGLTSDGGVHSHINHLKALIDITEDYGLNKVFIHAFTDGRDCDPHSGKGFIQDLMEFNQNKAAKIASITGRYYAMDRDKRWERVKIAYDAMVNAKGNETTDPVSAIATSYEEGVSDEFMQPIICVDENSKPLTKIEDGDVVIFFNFRTDRPRQITEVLTQKAYPDYDMQPLDLYFVTMTNYDDTYKNIHIVYEENVLKNTMGEVLANNEMSQIRIAETEKYPHVTFFFSGGRESAFEGESRILCPSPKEVPTYDLKPEMAAYEIRQQILPEIKKGDTDFICLNFANADMVGHTGNFDAAKKACEVVDECAKSICDEALKNGYSVAIIADHGNSDIMINPDGTPNTQHTTNPVPFFFATPKGNATIKSGKLGDLAPSFLQWMGIEIPEEMTGDIIIEKTEKE